MMELQSSNFWMLNYNAQTICIQTHKKVWKQKFKMKRPQSMYIENMRIPSTEDLLLYYNPFSFSSQKVLMALYEKNLPFRSRIIDLNKAEQYEKWYLEISPNGEVPVLQDGNRIIANARNIINYIEEWYITATELVPQETEDLAKAMHFRNLLEGIPEVVLTIGSFLHEPIVDHPKPPFSHAIRQYIINCEEQVAKFVFQKAESYPEFSGSLRRKAIFLQARHDKIVNKKQYHKLLSDCFDALDQIEAELSTHSSEKKDLWLINETFGVADINLAVLLERIYRIGLSKKFWGNGKRPNIEIYFARVQKHKSFIKAMPTSLMNLKLMYGIKACVAYLTAVLTCTLGLIFSIQRKANFEQLQIFK